MPAESHRGSFPSPGGIRGKAGLEENVGSLAWWHRPVTPARGRWRQEAPERWSCSHLHNESDVSLGYMSPYLKSRCPDLRAQRVTPDL